MPVDKLMKLFIIQAISAFVANDYNTGIHFLGEIKQTYAEKMSQLNPTLKQVAKEIIQAVDMFSPGGGTPSFEPTSPQQQPQDHQVQHDNQEQQPSSSVTSELQDLLARRREKKKKG